MVTSEDDDLIRIPHLKGEEEADYFTALASSIDIITHKEISGIFGNN